jgi:hypothetical protein
MRVRRDIEAAGSLSSFGLSVPLRVLRGYVHHEFWSLCSYCGKSRRSGETAQELKIPREFLLTGMTVNRQKAAELVLGVESEATQEAMVCRLGRKV